jgi:MFS family permease
MALVLGAVFTYWASMYLYVPTLPVVVQSRTADLELVGLVLSMYGLWQALIRLPVGIAADWFGWRMPFIIAGFVLAAAGALVMGASRDVNGLIIGRSITGLAAGAWVPLVVVVSTLFPPEQAVRAAAVVTMVNAVSRMAATSLTGWLNELGGYPLAFSLAAGLALVSIVLLLPAGEARKRIPPPTVAAIGRLVVRKDVLLPALLNALAQYMVWASTFSFVPIVARSLGATDFHQSMLVSLTIGAGIIGNLITTALARRTGNRLMVIAGFILTAASLVLVALSPSLLWVFVAQFINGAAGGVVYPVLMGMSIERVQEKERTMAMGLHQAVYAIGMFTGPWLSGILAKAMGIPPMLIITAVATLVVAIAGSALLPGRSLQGE